MSPHGGEWLYMSKQIKPPRTLKAQTHAFTNERVVSDILKHAAALQHAIDNASIISIQDTHELEVILCLIELRRQIRLFIEVTREIRTLREMPL